MDTKKAVSAIVYDKRGDAYFFLVLHSAVGWELPKGEIRDDEEEIVAAARIIESETGLGNFEIKGALVKTREIDYKDVTYSFKNYLAEANMNVVVDLNKDYDNYLWAKKSRIIEKLHWPQERDFFKEALVVLDKL